MQNKKPFLERYKEWRDNAHKWADEHPILGFPIKHTFALLFGVFLIVTLVCGIANVAANNKKYSNDPVSSSLVPQRARVDVNEYGQLNVLDFGDVRDGTLYYSATNSNIAFDSAHIKSNMRIGNTETGSFTFPSGSYAAGYYYFELPNPITYYGYDVYAHIMTYDYDLFPSGSTTNRLGVFGTAYVNNGVLTYPGNGSGLTMVSFRSDNTYTNMFRHINTSYETYVCNAVYFRVYNAMTFDRDAVFGLSLFRNNFPSYDGFVHFVPYQSLNDAIGTAYADGYSDGVQSEHSSAYATGYADGVDDGFEQGKQAGYLDGMETGRKEGQIVGEQIGYARGKEDGYQLGNTSDMTLTTLFWNVIDEPFAIIYRLLNFDVLGVNVFAFVMGLVTVGLIGFIIKLVI